jgi:hypothetical protein
VSRQLAGLQDEEQEAQEGPRGRIGEVVGEQFAGAWCGGWLADDGYPLASFPAEYASAKRS